MEVESPQRQQQRQQQQRVEERGGLLSNHHNRENGNTTTNSDDNNSAAEHFCEDLDIHNLNHQQQTTGWQTFIHLLKGYVGPGCLSLPWAVSQLGIPLGCVGCALVAYWTSYNCWTVVELRRYIQAERAQQTRQQQQQQQQQEQQYQYVPQHKITFAQVGEWAHGNKFKSIITGCICIQQLAVCTVFLSFIGENLHAVLVHIGLDQDDGDAATWFSWTSHIGVITLSLPFIMVLSCLPNLKILAPVIGFATALLFAGFAILGILCWQNWDDRPKDENDMDVHWSKVPTALCAILYSYEGICLVLPVEDAMVPSMKYKHFFTLFVHAMTASCIIFIFVSTMCVVAFGNITNGSITAFLLEQYDHDIQNNNDNDQGKNQMLLFLLLSANTAVSISVLLTYPLQMYPCLELMGPWFQKKFYQIGNQLPSSRPTTTRNEPRVPSPLHEDGIITHFTPLSMMDDGSAAAAAPQETQSPQKQPKEETTTTTRLTPVRDTSTTATTAADGSSIGSHSHHSGTESNSHHGTTTTTITPTALNYDDDDSSFTNNRNGLFRYVPEFKSTITGDSPLLRTLLVLLTYVIAVVVPNVQALISLSGAIAGTSVALLFPPILQLEFFRRRQMEEIHQQLVNSDDEGQEQQSLTTTTATTTTTTPASSMIHEKYLYKRIESYFLLLLGITFGSIGAGASIWDIVQIYRNNNQ